MRFVHPEILWLILVLPLLGAATWWNARRRAAVLIPPLPGRPAGLLSVRSGWMIAE